MQLTPYSAQALIVEFEPTNAFCYHFSRYEALPEIVALPQVQSGEPFRLIELVKVVADRHLTADQQATTYLRAETGEPQKIIRAIKWYVPFIAKNTKQLVPLGNGIYRLPQASDFEAADLEDSALEDGDAEVADFDGFIYAFTFPTLMRPGAVFPIKVGMTATDVQHRVLSQCRSAATFENPKILGSWKVARVGHVESAVHKVLAARGKWREGVPGAEWFDTTLEEIQSIIEFTTGKR
jgi:hypothetical protein